MSGISIPWHLIVRRADPDRDRSLSREPQYEFKGRVFTADGRRTGVYQPRAPRNVRPPKIIGSAVVGSVVRCDPGEHIGSPDPTILFQWAINSLPLPMGTDITLLLIEADAGASLTCDVTASNGNGTVTTTTEPVIVAART